MLLQMANFLKPFYYPTAFGISTPKQGKQLENRGPELVYTPKHIILYCTIL